MKKSTITTLIKVMEQKVVNVSEMVNYNQERYDYLSNRKNANDRDLSSGVEVKSKVDEGIIKVHKDAIEKFTPVLKRYQEALEELKEL